MEKTSTDREKLVRWIRKWGDVNTDALLEEGCQAFTLPDVEGFIGYRIEEGQAIVFGDPVSSDEEKPLFAEAFQKWCQEKNLGVVYTIVSKKFTEWAHQHLNAASIEFGQKFIFDPFHNPLNSTGPNAVRVRGKMKQALKEGVTIHEYTGEDADLEEKLMDVATAWVQRRRGPQVYLAHIHLYLFKDKYGKRLFYAKQEGHVIGVMVLNQLESHQGWLLNNIMTVGDAPHGVSELLIVTALQELEKENCHYVLAGPAPSKWLGTIGGIHPALAVLIRGIYQGARLIFHLDGYKTFWKKFQHTHESCYLVFPNKNLNFFSVKALMRAFNMEIS